MAQENEDISSTFSTLNVNAMEFVPSFCMDEPEDQSPVTAQAPTPPAAAAQPEQPVPEPVVNTNSVPAANTTTISSSNNGELSTLVAGVR